MTINNDKLSIIVPVYNVQSYLNRCISSIVNQTYRNLEIILVDDGSTDNSGKLCDSYALHDNRIKVIHKTNGGLSSARNAGLSVVTGHYIGFVDSDDYIEPNMYELLLESMRGLHADIVCAETFIERGNHKKYHPRFKENCVFTHEEALNILLDGSLDTAVWNKLYKASLFKNLTFIEGRIYEDVGFLYKVFDKANVVAYVNKPLYHYIKRKGSIVSDAFNAKSRYHQFLSYKERWEYFLERKYINQDKSFLQVANTAMGAMTAFYACNEDKKSHRFIEVESFISKISVNKYARKHLKNKYRLFLVFPILHRFYSTLSLVSKYIKNM